MMQAERDDGGQELLKNLGAHLRAARQERQLTLAQVAARAGLTKGFLSQLERGESGVSISSLLSLCNVFEISIAALLEQANVAATVSPIVRVADRRIFYLGGQGVTDELVSPPRDRRFEVFETRIGPLGSPGEEPWAVDADLGFAYVVRGRLEFSIGGATHVLERGDTITYTPRDAHTFRNPSASRPAVVIFMKSPAAF